MAVWWRISRQGGRGIVMLYLGARAVVAVVVAKVDLGAQAA